jgi:predicted site-specific integrase-resolvase
MALLEQDIATIKAEWERKKYFTDSELCAMYDVSPQTTLRWRKQKKIAYLRTPSGTIRYLRRHVEEFEARCEQKAS